MDVLPSTILQIFRRHDSDDSGTISGSVIAKVLQTLDPAWDDGKVHLLLEGFGVGLDNSIPYEAFLTWITDSALGAVQGSLTVDAPVARVVYTLTDESPLMATYSLLPIVRFFTRSAGIAIDVPDISVSGRILAKFSEHLHVEQRAPDVMVQLGALAESPAASILKLPNISASLPQLKAAIKELQSHGYAVPDYPEVLSDDQEKEVQAQYKKVLGSAVNPVLRQGNSDRRSAAPVKEDARKNPHSMGAWNAESKTHIASMTAGDFFGSEQTAVIEEACSVRIELVDPDDNVTVLKSKVVLLAGEVVDGSVMCCKELKDFYEREISDCKKQGVLCSLHLKASMMKASDPPMFGHMVSVFFKDAFETHAQTFAELNINPNNGLGDVYAKIASLDEDKRRAIEADLQAIMANRPELAMVDVEKKITNLHVPSDVIIDASMPAAIRSSGQMNAPDGSMRDIKAIIPDRCYAGIFEETVKYCKQHGAFDPSTMGSVSNVGLMAQSAEEYGSHDKTFEVAQSGRVRVVDVVNGRVFLEHEVEKGDIWRMCQVKDLPIQDWVKLAVARARATGSKAVFWLNDARPHEAALIAKVQKYLPEHNTNGLDIQIMSPVEACRLSLERASRGDDTISVTGNVLRDYLTDLFPILELGTSAKMLSLVPMLAGGSMYETGAGGTAPKLFRQFLSENHLRWDSLGEFMALAVCLEDIAARSGNLRAKVLANTLNRAVGRCLELQRKPSKGAPEIDTRGSHFYLALYWAKELHSQETNEELQLEFGPIASLLAENRQKIIEEIKAVQGKPPDLGGYYHPDPIKCTEAMRPSQTFNSILQ